MACVFILWLELDPVIDTWYHIRVSYNCKKNLFHSLKLKGGVFFMFSIAIYQNVTIFIETIESLSFVFY